MKTPELIEKAKDRFSELVNERGRLDPDAKLFHALITRLESESEYADAAQKTLNDLHADLRSIAYTARNGAELAEFRSPRKEKKC